MEPLLAILQAGAGCGGATLRADAGLMLGTSWRALVDSHDNYLEHLKEGFALMLDLTFGEDAVAPLLDALAAEAAAGALPGGLVEALPVDLDALPRGVLNLGAAASLNWALSAGDIDDMIENFPTLLPGWERGRFPYSGNFRADLLELAIHYEYLRDYRSPYADIHDLWLGEHEE